MQAAPGSSSTDDGSDDDEAIFADINITPLTDIFLVLLIIFMVVSSSMVEAEKQSSQSSKGLQSERALQVQTPQGTGDSPLVPKDVVISILPDGTLFVDSDEVTMDGLSDALTAVKARGNITRVVIRGDEAATYDLIMKVIAKCRVAGLTDIALASRASH